MKIYWEVSSGHESFRLTLDLLPGHCVPYTPFS